MIEVPGIRAITQQSQNRQIDVNTLWVIKMVVMCMNQKDHTVLFKGH